MTKSVSATGLSTSSLSSNPSNGAVNRATYLKHLLTQASAAADESALPLKELRDEAIAQISDRTFPSGRDEEWRFTDLSEMLNQPFQRAPQNSEKQVSGSALVPNAHQLTSLNGHTLNSSEGAANAAGVVIAPLSELIKTDDYAQKLEPLISKHLAKVNGAEEVFTALNTAGFTDVMVVWAKADTVLDTPVCIVRESQGNFVAHLRTLVIAERHAKLTLVESFAHGGQADEQTARCNTSVTEMWLAEGAQVNHIRLQDEGAETFHIAKTAVDQAVNSRYQCTAIDLGAKLSRHHLEVYQSGPQTDTHMYGLSALSDRQLADTHSLLTLTHPYSTATQIQKNIVDDRAHAVFNGRVFVSQTAQLTDASQINRNLMLSSKARIDTKPELDIVADNVKCAHGATVSQLQADEVFYLQSRGISAEQAQRLLLYGFAMEIVEKISIESLRQSLSDRLTEWAQ
ncbi:MAG: Fe-S cluster assembly protein SufD [Cyanobacteria bacterium J06621_3]